MNGTKYTFRTPVDFGYGGLSMIDGKIMKQQVKSIWEGGKSKKLDYTVTLDQGMHAIELYGAEKCCDGTTKWSFSVQSKALMGTDDASNDKCLRSQPRVKKT
jgi:hypothetical protein